MSITREKEDQYSDWENARNWLMHPDVTKMSAKVIETLFKVISLGRFDWSPQQQQI